MNKPSLFAAIGLFTMMMPAFPVAECVKCDMFQACVTDVGADACECRSRAVNGNIICREVGVCELGCGTSGIPKILATTDQMIVEVAALNQLSERDSLLGTLLLGSLVSDSKGILRRLDPEPYDGGTLRTENGEVFRHRGSYSPQPTGEIYFRFTLESINGLESIKYVGSILNHGNDIRSTRIDTDDQGKPRRSSQDFHFELKPR